MSASQHRRQLQLTAHEHRMRSAPRGADARRDRALEAAGLRVLRVPALQVLFNLSGVLLAILTQLS